ncbi:MAG TPA: GspE/PulE family protein [Candidatus Paceibacterota bacterium]|nr:GspE/PulE family protein [Candidatus Paceibacterota bacterium]
MDDTLVQGSENDLQKDRSVRTIRINSEDSGPLPSSGIGVVSVTEKLRKSMAGGKPGESLEDKSKRLNIPTRHVVIDEVPYDILDYVPEDSAMHYQVVPLSQKEGVIEVGMVDPDDIEARNALTFIFSRVSLPFTVTLISHDDFQKVVGLYKGLSGEVTKALSDLDTELRNEADIAVMQQKSASEEEGSGGQMKEDAPITKIVATILRYATEGLASDVHIEGMRDVIRVRFRVDGILNTSLSLPINVQSAVVARIKILCNMKLDERRRPQDGRFSARIEGKKVDFRVSTFPTYFGEKVVMRILDHERGMKRLDDLHITDRNLKIIKDAIKKPYGLILISGPTGSGKTTTLYSMLQEVDRETKNVLSLEDPIEYNIEGVSQSQVFPEIGYTFATGLRTTLRQDPDVILVGEIRDKETAQLAIQAALTGHLVLSTIHTNNAAGVIPRLIDMGVDPFLIAPTLQLAIAQRLGAVICKDGAEEVKVEGTVTDRINKHFEELNETQRAAIKLPEFVYEKGHSSECPTGTKGRMAAMEVIEMDRELERVILSGNPTEESIMNIARKQGMLSMREDAMLKALEGFFALSEVDAI